MQSPLQGLACSFKHHVCWGPCPLFKNDLALAARNARSIAGPSPPPPNYEIWVERRSDRKRQAIRARSHRPEVSWGDHAGPASKKGTGQQKAARQPASGQPQWRLAQKGSSTVQQPPRRLAMLRPAADAPSGCLRCSAVSSLSSCRPSRAVFPLVGRLIAMYIDWSWNIFTLHNYLGLLLSFLIIFLSSSHTWTSGSLLQCCCCWLKRQWRVGQSLSLQKINSIHINHSKFLMETKCKVYISVSVSVSQLGHQPTRQAS